MFYIMCKIKRPILFEDVLLSLKLQNHHSYTQDGDISFFLYVVKI